MRVTDVQQNYLRKQAAEMQDMAAIPNISRPISSRESGKWEAKVLSQGNELKKMAAEIERLTAELAAATSIQEQSLESEDSYLIVLKHRYGGHASNDCYNTLDEAETRARQLTAKMIGTENAGSYVVLKTVKRYFLKT